MYLFLKCHIYAIFTGCENGKTDDIRLNIGVNRRPCGRRRRRRWYRSCLCMGIYPRRRRRRSVCVRFLFHLVAEVSEDGARPSLHEDAVLTLQVANLRHPGPLDGTFGEVSGDAGG